MSPPPIKPSMISPSTPPRKAYRIVAFPCHTLRITVQYLCWRKQFSYIFIFPEMIYYYQVLYSVSLRTKGLTCTTTFWLHTVAYRCSGCPWWATVLLCPQGFLLKTSLTLCLRAFSVLRKMLGQWCLREAWSARELTPWSSSQSIKHSSWWRYAQAPCLSGGTTLLNVLLHLPEVPRRTEHQLPTVITCSLIYLLFASSHPCLIAPLLYSACCCHLSNELLALKYDSQGLLWRKPKVKRFHLVHEETEAHTG